MAYRCPHYLCDATSIEGLIQQIALSYLRHGYWWYVTGLIPDRKNPVEVDHTIVTKYDIRKDWRFMADNKARGLANLQYIRYSRFYVIMATKGWHVFKDREAKRIRDVRKVPILIPRQLDSAPGLLQRAVKSARVFDGYAVSYRRGAYVKKSPEEKAAYRAEMARWRQETSLGKRLPRPAKGVHDPKWHASVAIERQTYLRLNARFLDIATHRSRENLVYELGHTGFMPYQPVKQQLVRIIRDVNHARRLAGCSEQIPYRVVLGLKRRQLAPFKPEDSAELFSAA